MRVDDDPLPRDSTEDRLEATLSQPVRDRDRADGIATAADAQDERAARFRDAAGIGEH